MNFVEYQRKAGETAIYPGQKELLGLLYAVLGLTGEAGELANKLKKVIRDSNGVVTQEFVDFMNGELGDVLWYLAITASELGLSLETIAENNITKLHSRKERGVLTGNGDNR